MKEAIKKILKFGSVEIPYKTQIDQWYSKIYIHTYEGKYCIYPGSYMYSDIDEAVTTFMRKALSSNNVGYIQERLQKKGINFEMDYDLENPDDEVKKMFEDEGKIVDEELQLMLNLNSQ